MQPVALDRFLDEIKRICRKVGIEIDANDGKRVFCLNVKLEMVAGTPASVH
jgi:hypothetical protein